MVQILVIDNIIKAPNTINNHLNHNSNPLRPLRNIQAGFQVQIAAQFLQDLGTGAALPQTDLEDEEVIWEHVEAVVVPQVAITEAECQVAVVVGEASWEAFQAVVEEQVVGNQPAH